MKLAEDRYRNLQKRSQLTEDALLQFEKELRAQLRVVTQQVSGMRKKLMEISTTVDAMQGELKHVVQRHELKAIERYVDLWQPVDFITRDEAKRMMKHG